MSLVLPPLNALRAFESAARCGNYVAAAEELNVSPAAVSQHIRKLEEFLGKHLFTRHNNRVQLTDAGEEIFHNIHQAFLEIADSTARAMGERPRSRLIISSRASVIGRWLVPKLDRFAAAQPDFRFDLRVEEGPVDLARSGIDLRLTYGPIGSAEMKSHLLVHDEVVPLCAPAYLAKLAVSTREAWPNVPDEDLIHTEWGPDFGSLPSWQDWFNLFGEGRRIGATGNQVSHSLLALDLAERGFGVALGQKMLAEEALRRGLLVMLSPHTIKLRHAYNLNYLTAKGRKPMLKALVAFLTDGDEGSPLLIQAHAKGNPVSEIIP